MKQHPEVFNRRLFLEPGEAEFERRAVLNPCIHEEEGTLHMLYRAVAPDMVSSMGYLKLRYEGEEPVVDWRSEKPLMVPEEEFEIMGIEDPRLVKYDNNLHLFYTAYDGNHARLAHAFGPSIENLGNRHLIGPLFTNEEAIKIIKDNPKLGVYRDRWSMDSPSQYLWEKDATIFPRRIDGKIVMIHRLRPDIQIAYLDSLDQLDDNSYWEDYLRHMDEFRLMACKEWWEDSHIGMGPVPIETEAGWLMIYHGVTQKPRSTYRAGAALLDLNDPQRIIGKTIEPLFEPIEDWENVGDVNNVVFPEGLVVQNGTLDIFYGGADSVIGVISVKMEELLDFLTSQG